MKATGKLIGASVDLSGTLTVTLSINEKADCIPVINDMDREQVQSIEIKPYRKKRSLDANAMLWSCIGDMAAVLRADKWEVYLQMLKRYGVFTYISVRKNAVERLKEMWRECEVVGEEPDGRVNVLCFYGSSTYNTQEFSVLLDGVISDMKELGLTPPLPKEIERSLCIWEERHSAK